MEEFFDSEPVIPNNEPERSMALRWRTHFFENNVKTTGYKWVDNKVVGIVDHIYTHIKDWENSYPIELPAREPPSPERDERHAKARAKFDATQNLPWIPYLRENVRVGMTIYLVVVHVLALIGLAMAGSAKPQTLLWTLVLWPATAFGITGGVHRFWAHRSYRAAPIVRFYMMILNSIANQGTIWHWARDHRVHHKCSETPADPHNALRGFFFSHVGWLIVKKDPRVGQFGESINLDDLASMYEVRLQKYMGLKWSIFWCFLFPALVASTMWGENFLVGIMLPGFFRYVFVLHGTWLVNSAAHLYGERPYENINPSEVPFVSLFAIGEGWHNWHHAFPSDSYASELGISKQFNPTSMWISWFHHMGLVHSRKDAQDHWKRRMKKLAKGDKVETKLIGMPGFLRRVVYYGPNKEERIYGDQTPVKLADVLDAKKAKLLAEGTSAGASVRDRSPKEVARHNVDEDSWSVIRNKVYDVTEFMTNHPGGEEAVAVFQGKTGRHDATQSYEDTGHSEAADEMLAALYVGDLVEGAPDLDKPLSSSRSSARITSTSSRKSSRHSTRKADRKSVRDSSSTDADSKRLSRRKSSRGSTSETSEETPVSTLSAIGGWFGGLTFGNSSSSSSKKKKKSKNTLYVEVESEPEDPNSFYKDGDKPGSKLSLRKSSSRTSARKSQRKSVRASARQSAAIGDVVLSDSTKRVGFELMAKEEVTHDSILLHLKPSSSLRRGLPLGLPLGRHISIADTIDGKMTQRSYTPIPSPAEFGPDAMSILLKVYKAGVDPNFPKGGKMSQHLDNIEVGGYLAIKGPLGSITYFGEGQMNLRRRGDFKVDHVGFICGGTGITPAYPIIVDGLNNPNDTTKFSLIYANKTPEDIMLRGDLDALAAQHPDRFHLHYTVNDASSEPGWEYSVGYADKDMIRTHLPSPEDGEVFAGLCGPPPMVKAMMGHLEGLGYVKGQNAAAF